MVCHCYPNGVLVKQTESWLRSKGELEEFKSHSIPPCTECEKAEDGKTLSPQATWNVVFVLSQKPFSSHESLCLLMCSQPVIWTECKCFFSGQKFKKIIRLDHGDTKFTLAKRSSEFWNKPNNYTNCHLVCHHQFTRERSQTKNLLLRSCSKRAKIHIWPVWFILSDAHSSVILDHCVHVLLPVGLPKGTLEQKLERQRQEDLRTVFVSGCPKIITKSVDKHRLWSCVFVHTQFPFHFNSSTHMKCPFGCFGNKQSTQGESTAHPKKRKIPTFCLSLAGVHHPLSLGTANVATVIFLVFCSPIVLLSIPAFVYPRFCLSPA